MPDDERAVMRLLELKHRAVSKGLILIASNYEQITPYIGQISSEIKNRIMKTWPGPVTWLLPASPDTPKWITGQYDT
ncbi:MAG: Sua5/YciO/YrdC/YwlC family protein, partial [Gammaproteobacteria bacterium]